VGEKPSLSEYVRDIIRKEFQHWLRGRPRTEYFNTLTVGYNPGGTQRTTLLEVKNAEGFLEIVRLNLNIHDVVCLEVWIDGEPLFNWDDWGVWPELVWRGDLLAHGADVRPSLLSSDHYDTAALEFVIQYWPMWPGDYFSRHLKVDLLNRSTTTAYTVRRGYIKYRVLPR